MCQTGQTTRREEATPPEPVDPMLVIVTVRYPVATTRPGHYGMCSREGETSINDETHYRCMFHLMSAYPIVVRYQSIQWEVRRCYKQTRRLHTRLEETKEEELLKTLPQLPPKLKNPSLKVVCFRYAEAIESAH